MTALAEPDRQRLIRLLGMLGSEHQGERANAASLVDRFVRDHGLTWDRIIPANGKTNGAAQPQPKPKPRTWRDVLDECAAHEYDLSEWEKDFLLSLARWRGYPTGRQEERLRELADRLGIEWPEWPE